MIRFMTILPTAVISIDTGSIGVGLINLSVASTTSQTVTMTKNATLMSVPITSALCHPNVICSVDGFKLILMASMDIMNPIISVAKCAQSVKIAMELDKYPPII